MFQQENLGDYNLLTYDLCTCIWEPVDTYTQVSLQQKQKSFRENTLLDYNLAPQQLTFLSMVMSTASCATLGLPYGDGGFRWRDLVRHPRSNQAPRWKEWRGA